MVEYIEREGTAALFERVAELVKGASVTNPEHRVIAEGFAVAMKDTLRQVAKDIRSIPAADVAPVRRGEWVWDETWSESTPDHPSECETAGWECNQCETPLSQAIRDAVDETTFCDNFEKPPQMPFCPNCGAKMC